MFTEAELDFRVRGRCREGLFADEMDARPTRVLGLVHPRLIGTLFAARLEKACLFEGGQMPGPGVLQHIDGQVIEPMVLPSGPVLLFPRSAPQPSQPMAVGFDGVEQDTERGADAVFLRCRVSERRKVMSGRHRGVFRPGKDPGRNRQFPRRADQAKSLEMREKGAWR